MKIRRKMYIRVQFFGSHRSEEKKLSAAAAGIKIAVFFKELLI
jgi:hypothetical protein